VGRRPKKGNSENVYWRGGVWYIRFKFRGRLYRESSKSKDKEIAKALFDQRRREIEEGRFIGLKPEQTKFADLEKLILRDYEANGRKSIKSLTDRVASLRRTFGSVRPVDVTYAMLEEYKEKRQAEGAKNATIRYELVVFGRMYSLGIKWRLLTTKPLLPTVKVENARKGFFSEEHFQRVLERLPLDVAAAMMFAYFTGWRVGEIRKLTWANVNFEEGVVRLEADETKNEQARVFPFEAHEYLRGLLEAQRKHIERLRGEQSKIVPWVFPRLDGRQLGQFHKQWTAACREAGVPGRVPHDLRRTAVRNLMRAGVNERVAMTLTGHKTRSIFDRYHIVSEADLAEAVKKLSERNTGA
jgi:integrase